MTDPWAEMREFTFYFDDGDKARSLLRDADALLEVVRADLEYDDAQIEWYDVLVNTNDTERQATASARIKKANDVRKEALAALPEHLK